MSAWHSPVELSLRHVTLIFIRFLRMLRAHTIVDARGCLRDLGLLAEYIT